MATKVNTLSRYVRQNTKASFSTISTNNDRLQHVHCYHRHGDRTPWYPVLDDDKERNLWVNKISKHYSSFNTQNNEQIVSNSEITTWNHISSKLRACNLKIESTENIEYSKCKTNDGIIWPFLGQLTDKGCNELENVGKWLRNKYIDNLNFLPSIYNINDNNLHYISTNRARTIQSADCLLHGLYPMDKRINNGLIPLFVDHPKNEYTFLNPGTLKRICNKFQQKSEYNLNRIISTFDSDFDEYFQSVLSYYSLDQDILHNDAQPDMGHDIAHDAVHCRMMHNINDIPRNITNEYLIEFGKYLVKCHCAQMSLDRESLRLSWGNVVYKMLNEMNMDLEGESENDKRFIINSCHDNSLLAVLCTIYGDNIFKMDLKWPPYASWIIFEVWKNDINKKRYVRVLYNGELLNVFDGKDYIDLDELNQKWKDIMIDEDTFFNHECA